MQIELAESAILSVTVIGIFSVAFVINKNHLQRQSSNHKGKITRDRPANATARRWKIAGTGLTFFAVIACFGLFFYQLHFSQTHGFWPYAHVSSLFLAVGIEPPTTQWMGLNRIVIWLLDLPPAAILLFMSIAGRVMYLAASRSETPIDHP